MFRAFLLLNITCLMTGFLITGCSTDCDSTSALYLGQTPPGLKAKVFAPGIVSTKENRDRDICFSADFSELYFTRNSRIMMMQREGDLWSEPEPAPFASNFQEFESFLSPDNQRLYFISRRPLDSGSEPEEFQMWMVDRTDEGWGAPERLNDRGDYYPSITSSGVMYFTDSSDNICRTRLVDGRMTKRDNLGDSINTEAAEYNACIAPDESFLIFTSRGWGDGFGGPDMYVSFRSEDDHWTTPRNMGVAVNSSGLEYCPCLSPDGAYLFFVRRDGNGENVYWIDAGIVDTLRKYDMDVSLGIYHAAVAEGPEKTAELYERVRDENATYRDFDGDLLTGLADRLFANERTVEAITLLNLCFKLHPESATAFQRLKLAAFENNRPAFDKIAEEMKQKTKSGRGHEALINVLGYNLIGWGKIDAAINVLRLNTELFPESGNVFDSYAEGLLLQGDTAGSIENYRKSLDLNPENNNAVLMLRRLGVK